MEGRVGRALEILRQGGYWRQALETGYGGREQFATHLYYENGQRVRGIGYQTWDHHQRQGLLRMRLCTVTSAWPTEWVLREETNQNERSA